MELTHPWLAHQPRADVSCRAGLPVTGGGDWGWCFRFTWVEAEIDIYAAYIMASIIVHEHIHIVMHFVFNVLS